MKKHLLIISFFISQATVSYNEISSGITLPFGHIGIHQPVSNTLILGLFTVAATALVANNLYWHSTYSQKATSYYDLIINTIKTKNISNISDPCLTSLLNIVDFDTIIQHELWLNNSYNNWLTFWNWTASQKQALEKFNTILILSMYGHLIQLQNAGTLTTENLKKDFRLKFGLISIYPLITASNTMKKHCDFVANNIAKFPIEIQTLLQQALVYFSEFQVLLRQDADYIKELSDKKTHDLQEELIHATLISRHPATQQPWQR